MHSIRRSAEDHTSIGDPAAHSLESGILQAVAYSDIFDYPLTPTEIHRYLVGVRASWRQVRAHLNGTGSLSGRLSMRAGYYFMRGRDGIVETRRRRSEVAARMWPRARHYGAAVAHLPFVRMVAVTGALAMDNVDPGTDIDYLVVTEPGRLWLCRAMVVALVRLAARKGDTVCPNYFLSERALDLGEPNLFTAHELAQMVPLAGMETYRRMCRLNSWAAAFLPNAFDAPRRVSTNGRHGAPLHAAAPEPAAHAETRPLLWSLAEASLRTPLGAPLERWEMSRKVRKLRGQSEACVAGGCGPKAEINLSADRCKGHFDSHRQRTLEAYSQRLRALHVGFPDIRTTDAADRS